MKTLFAVITLLSSFSSLAELPIFKPVTYSRIRHGETPYSSVFCPDVNKRYEDFTEQLSKLKELIKKDAKCNDEKSKVDGFAELVEKGRGEFWSIIKKGQSEKLSVEDTNKLTAYIESVTKAGGTVVDLAIGSSCFKDDKKGLMSLDLVASVIGESTQALSTVSGAYGPVVSLAGRMTSGLITSIDKVARSRQAYDFDDPDQRKVFMKTLCSYNGFRPSLDEISRTDQRIRDLKLYKETLEKLLTRMNDKCPECKALADKYYAEYHKEPRKARLPLWELHTQYEADITEINKLYVQRLGIQTINTAAEIDESEDHLKRLDELVSDFGDVERDRVVQMQSVIEDFLINKQLPQIVDFYRKELTKRTRNLKSTLWNQLDMTEQDYAREVSVAELVTRIFDPKSRPLRTFKSERDVRNYKIAVQAEADRRLSEIVSALQIIEKTCQFSRSTASKYEFRMSSMCDEKAKPILQQTYTTLWVLLQGTHKDSTVIKSAFEVPSPTLLDLAEKLKVKLPGLEVIWTANDIQSLTGLTDLINQMDDTIFAKK